MVGGDVAARDPLGEIVVKLDAHSYGLKKMATRRTSVASPRYWSTFPDGSRLPLAMSETNAAETPR